MFLAKAEEQVDAYTQMGELLKLPPMLEIYAGVMVLISILMPVAAIYYGGVSVGINLWGISISGASVYWWSIPSSGSAGLSLALLTMSFVIAIIAAILGFVTGKVMFSKRDPHICATSTYVSCLLALVLFWIGLGTIPGFTSGGVWIYPHIGTFTLITGSALSFWGLKKFNASSLDAKQAKKAGILSTSEISIYSKKIFGLITNKKILGIILVAVIIVATIGFFAYSNTPPASQGNQNKNPPPTNNTPLQLHPPYHTEYDTPAMSGATPGGIGVYQYVENKFPVDANATKLTAKLVVNSKIGPRLEIHYIIKDAKGKELKNLMITSDSGGTIDISNTALNSSGPGQYTSRVEVYKGTKVVCHIVIDVAYNATAASK